MAEKEKQSEMVKVFGGIKKVNGEARMIWHLMTWEEFAERKKEFGFDARDDKFEYAQRYAKTK